MGEIERFRAMLQDWSERINLVGPSALPTFWLRHAYDSAQVLHVEQSARRWADVGAGAGFPGMILAILLKGQVGARVELIESLAKRIRFLEAVAAELDLPVHIHHGRAESLVAPDDIEVVTARACAPLDKLLGFTRPFFKIGARGVFLKGRTVESELTEARRSWTFRADIIPSRSDPMGRILRVEGVQPRAG